MLRGPSLRAAPLQQHAARVVGRPRPAYYAYGGPAHPAGGQHRAAGPGWHSETSAFVSGLAALRVAFRSLRRRFRSPKRVLLHAAGLKGAGGLPAYDLKSICGLRSEPFANSQLQVQGELPAGFSVAAVSSTGRKGRVCINQDCVALQHQSDGRWVGVVVDGHGSDGHHASSWLCNALPSALAETLNSADVPEACRVAFADVDRELQSVCGEEGFSVNQSGGTVAAAVLSPDKNIAYLVSTGDAQAVVFDAETGTFQETRPHKAHDEEERARIEAAGGFVKVRQMGDEIFSRVYDPSRSFGLAMSRSFGDVVVKRHGVTSEPSVVPVPLSKSSRCVLGSDGLFEVMRPAEVVDILMQRWDVHGPQACAEALVAEAQKRWFEAEGGYCDDVTCLVFGPGGVAGSGPALAD